MKTRIARVSEFSSHLHHQIIDELPSVATRVIYLVHPSLRPLIIRLLSQIRAYTVFVQNLRRPILQPESKFFPTGVNMDPRATLVARERIEGLIARSGVDLVIWGKALEEVKDREHYLRRRRRARQCLSKAATESDEDLQVSLLTLDPALLRPFPTFPDPSSLFMFAQEDDEVDAITFLPLVKGILARCNRCRRKTADLPGTGYESGLKAGWKNWRAQRERGCGCGGCWVEYEDKDG